MNASSNATIEHHNLDTIDENGLSTTAIWLLAIFLGGPCVIGIMGLIYYFIKKYRRNRRKVKELRSTLNEIVDSYDRSQQTVLEKMGYSKGIEIRIKDINLGPKLGEGNFGIVHKGQLSNNTQTRKLANVQRGEPIDVAVKKLKIPDPEHVKSMKAEIKVMEMVRKHLNIVNLIGACTKQAGSNGVMIVIEYCEKGCLKKFLINQRHSFVQDVFDAYTTNGGTKAGTSKGYVDVRKAQKSDPSMLSTTKLISFVYQAARGMQFLSSQNIIHRDLAARNVLVTSNGIIKICDFGLAKDCYKYIQKSNKPLPVKWMAPESIADGEFTTRSDVWSYGILLWEIFSLGAEPYQGLKHDPKKILQKITGGHRMEKPNHCPQNIYKEVMLKCWDINPKCRTDFGKILSIVGHYFKVTAPVLYDPLQDIYSKKKLPCKERTTPRTEQPADTGSRTTQPVNSYGNTAYRVISYCASWFYTNSSSKRD